MRKQLLKIPALFVFFACAVSAAGSSYADFEKVCNSKLKQKNKGDICGCIVANYKLKKLTDSQVETITQTYKGKPAPVTDEQTNVLLDFDESVADLCLADPKNRIDVSEHDDAGEPKMSEKKSK